MFHVFVWFFGVVFFSYRYLRKTKGIQKIVRIATDQNRVYSPRVIKIANQVQTWLSSWKFLLVSLCVCVCVCAFFYFFYVWGTSQELLVAMRNPMFWGSQFVFLGLSHSSRSKERCNFTLFLFFTKATYLPGLIWNQIFRLHSFLFHLPMKLMEMWRAALFGTEQQDSAANICS